MEYESKIETKASSLGTSIVLAALIITGGWIYNSISRGGVLAAAANRTVEAQNHETAVVTDETVAPPAGVVLPVSFGDLGAKLVSVGAIDSDTMRSVYGSRGAFTKEYEELLFGENPNKLKITRENSGYLLNLFWALGLAHKNRILDSGEMANQRFGGAQNFASTAGWTIAKGNPMDHYSRHKFFDLTPEQQELVDKVSKGIFRPCCNNATHFPDCNHGMAMLGLLELMASQGVSEQEMYKTALAVNEYWFPDTYATIAAYEKSRGVLWNAVNPQEILGMNYSSASGYARIAAEVTEPQDRRGGGGCSVENGANAAPLLPLPKNSSGCGV